jgi:hypothetical protein
MRNLFDRARRFFVRTGDYWLAAILAAGAIFFFSGYFTTVRFDRERIEVELRTGRIYVRGLYHYTNSSALPAALTLQVPFPVDRHHPEPDWYALYESAADGRTLASLAPGVRGGEVYFRLLFGPRESKWIRLDYEQRAGTSDGRYLLTTTRAWRHPIGQADYVLHLAPDLELASSNYAVQPEPWPGKERGYAFSKTDFYPNQDWVFSWTEPSMQTISARGGQP